MQPEEHEFEITRTELLPAEIAKMEHLHSGYKELFHQVELLLHDIRRSGLITPEQLGSSRTLQQLYSRMGPKDEPDPDRKLIGKLQSEVNQALPPESLWMPEYHLTPRSS